MKLRDIGAQREIDPHVSGIGMFVVILGKLFSNLARRYANSRIGIRVVARIPSKDLDAQTAFLELMDIAISGLVDNVTKEGRIALTGGETRTS
jgi:hypothetical protein